MTINFSELISLAKICKAKEYTFEKFYDLIRACFKDVSGGAIGLAWDFESEFE